MVQLLIFIIETTIIVAAVLIIVSGIVGVLSKGKEKSKCKLKVKPLNKHFDELKKRLNQSLLSKKALKSIEKNQKKRR